MLQFLPNFIGRSFKHKRAGEVHSLYFDHSSQNIKESIAISSSDFENNGFLKIHNTNDGDGKFPKIIWRDYPKSTKSFMIIVEDLDSPTLTPLLHLIALGIPPTMISICHDDLIIAHQDHRFHIGRNSMMKRDWMPPDPPPGHGPHRYFFEIYALDTIPKSNFKFTRSAIKDLLKDHGVGKGSITGIYQRN